MKQGILTLVIIAVSAILFSVESVANGEIKTITAIHTYRMGDNDSRNEARRICFLEAKRNVLEQAGMYIESRTEIRNYRLSSDEVSAYSSALLTVETVAEKWADLSVTITVKAAVDTEYMKAQISKIREDKVLQREIREQQDKIKNLERAVAGLQEKIESADGTKAEPLRRERTVIVKQIDELESKKIVIVERIQNKSRMVQQYITKGMTMNDVRSLLGDADGTVLDYDGQQGGDVVKWHYGRDVIIFNSAGLVHRVE